MQQYSCHKLTMCAEDMIPTFDTPEFKLNCNISSIGEEMNDDTAKRYS